MALGFFQNRILLFAQGCEGSNHCLQQLGKNTDLMSIMIFISLARVQKKLTPQVPVSGRCDLPRTDSHCVLGFIPCVHLSLVPISDLVKGCYIAACGLCYCCPFSQGYSHFSPS